MFNYRDYLMQGFINAVGRLADYQIILNANGYFEKGVLEESDLENLQNLINEKNNIETNDI